MRSQPALEGFNNPAAECGTPSLRILPHPEQRGKVAIELFEEEVEIEEVVGGDGAGAGEVRTLGGGQFAERDRGWLDALGRTTVDHGGDEPLVLATVAADRDHPEVLAVADDREVGHRVLAATGVAAGDRRHDQPLDALPAGDLLGR